MKLLQALAFCFGASSTLVRAAPSLAQYLQPSTFESRHLSTRAASVAAGTLSFSTSIVERLDSAQDATTFALVYGIPLSSFANFIHPTLNSVGANALDNEQQLATSSSAAVTRPNVDTVYTRVAVDLSHYDVEITVPEFDDRFWVFPFSDMYGDQFASLCSINASSPGRYLMRPLDDSGSSEVGLLTPPFGSEYAGIITFPGIYGFMLIRIEAFNSGPDIENIHRYQSEISTQLVDRDPDPLPARGPALSPQFLYDNLPGSANATASLNLGLQESSSRTFPKGAAERILALLARLYSYSQPIIPDTLSNTTYNLALAGIFPNGSYNPPASVNLSLAETGVSKAIIADLIKPQNQVDLGNGWLQNAPSISGTFGADFAARAYIGFNDLAELLPYIAAYPEYVGEGAEASLNITANESIIFTFSRKPPVTAFWSVTVYNSKNYLVANPLDRYSLGDRSNLTYSDGMPIYGTEANANRDGEFQMLFQASDKQPPANWTSNWLPVQEDGGVFSVNLRLYGPTVDLVNGSYVYPVVTKGAAIVG